MHPLPKSLGDGGGRALVDASAAVDALAGVDDSDVLAGDGSLGADVHTCSACNTFRSVDCNHCDYLYRVQCQRGIKRWLNTV